MDNLKDAYWLGRVNGKETCHRAEQGEGGMGDYLHHRHAPACLECPYFKSFRHLLHLGDAELPLQGVTKTDPECWLVGPSDRGGTAGRRLCRRGLSGGYPTVQRGPTRGSGGLPKSRPASRWKCTPTPGASPGQCPALSTGGRSVLSQG